MATIKRFEDLEIWKKAREVCIKVKGLCDTTPLGKNFSLRDQILSSSGSCMDNIAEGFERDGNREFINFLYISKGSIGETRSQVHRSFDYGYFDKKTYDDVLNDCLDLSAQIFNFINYLHNSEIKGLKKKY